MTADIACQMLRMAANCGKHQRQTAAVRIKLPALAVGHVALFNRLGKSALDVLNLHKTHGANRAFGDELFRIPRHRIRRIAVRHAKHAVLLLCACCQIARFSSRRADRLVADHVEPRIQRRDAIRIVRVVRRHDRDGLNAILARLLGHKHGRHIRITARGLKPEARGRIT